MHDASPESCVDGADIAVGFMLNSVVLCWQSVFEIGTSCKKIFKAITTVAFWPKKHPD